MQLIYPEGDWKHFKGTGKKPYFFMCKFDSQIIYLENSDSWGVACPNCENTSWFGHLWLPITLDTAIQWFILTTGWLKDLLIADLLDSVNKKYKSIGELFYKLVFEDEKVKLSG